MTAATDPDDLPPLYLAADLRVLEQQHAAAHPDRSLMDRAGDAAAQLALTLASETGGAVLVLAGPGDNGGDALLAARRLRALGVDVSVAGLVGAEAARPAGDAARALAAWRADGGVVLDAFPHERRFGLVVDGLFGIGLARDVTGRAADWIAAANALPCPRLALDVPSGLDGDTGRVRGCAVVADHTLTFLGLKPGLLTADGPDHAGTLHVDTLGVEQAGVTDGVALTQLAPRHLLPPRRHNSHKGSYGHVGIVGGARGMVGACLLAGRAALHYGAGSVTLGVLDERIVVDPVEPRLMFAEPEALVGRSVQAFAAGPGLGRDARAAALFEAALDLPCPLVLDADALNLLAEHPAWRDRVVRRAAPTLLTPHPGEAARLLQTTPDAVQADRIETARTLAARFDAHVALKGAGTVIAHPDRRYAVNTSGGPWLAQAGSGDRLTGLVAALLAQRMAAGDALEAAVWLHGAAASPQPPGRDAG